MHIFVYPNLGLISIYVILLISKLKFVFHYITRRCLDYKKINFYL